uniref:Uncharacterized protein n=1 Tax=Timema poppense TaxID=170557 RepID=A0A7R9GXF2_TIMPO|nr:unnamed protein product [Timema poppensis]
MYIEYASSYSLRGAMSFALAIRNTVSEARQAMLTTTSLIRPVDIMSVGVEEEVELLPYTGIRSNVESTTPREISGSATSSNEKALLARLWGDFDSRYMKPFLTHTRPTLLETLPVCCNSLARLLTTTEQMTHDGVGRNHLDSNSDLGLEENELGYGETRRSSIHRVIFLLLRILKKSSSLLSLWCCRTRKTDACIGYLQVLGVAL